MVTEEKFKKITGTIGFLILVLLVWNLSISCSLFYLWVVVLGGGV